MRGVRGWVPAMGGSGQDGAGQSPVPVPLSPPYPRRAERGAAALRARCPHPRWRRRAPPVRPMREGRGLSEPHPQAGPPRPFRPPRWRSRRRGRGRRARDGLGRRQRGRRYGDSPGRRERGCRGGDKAGAEPGGAQRAAARPLRLPVCAAVPRALVGRNAAAAPGALQKVVLVVLVVVEARGSGGTRGFWIPASDRDVSVTGRTQ